MQRLKLLVLAAMAVLSLSALVAASASAVTPAAILPETEAVTFTGTSGPGTLTALGGVLKVECASDTSKGSLAAGAKLGPFEIDFKTCKDALSGSVCTGLGEASGIILVSGEAHLVVDVDSPALGAGMLFLVNLVHFTCGIVLTEVKGEVLCLIKPVATKGTHFEIVCEETAAGSGDPKETKYWNEAGTEVNINITTAGLLTSPSHAAFKGSAENTTALILTNKEITIDA
jgi:hypothetical protein